MENFLNEVDFLLWNGFLIYLLLLVGIYLTFRLKGMQFKYLAYSLKLAFTRKDEKAKGDISQFESLMTAMAATIGIGSIAGMATAIIGGGFGAIFWMWLVALVGMVTKFSEAILAVKYRILDHRKQMAGGPMYYISRGLNWRWLAISFSIFGMLAAFAGGNLIQSQSISDAVYELFYMPHLLTGGLLAFFAGVVILGGIKSLGRVNSVLVPFMALFYVLGGLFIIAVNVDKIPGLIAQIFEEAFTGRSIIGGTLIGTFFSAIRLGIARGISSNEAGLGSAPIASAAAKTDVPGRQALISMSGVFLSSFVVCTITVLVIGVTQVVGKTDPQGRLLNGVPLVMEAFSSVIPGGRVVVAVGVVLFGFSTILGWSYYGEKCFEFLFGEKLILFYRIIFISIIFLGAHLAIGIVWPIADIMNGLMALPNLIGILFLSKIIIKESESFFHLVKREKRGTFFKH